MFAASRICRGQGFEVNCKVKALAVELVIWRIDN